MHLRIARLDECSMLTGLIARSLRGLGAGYYSAAQIEGALHGACGVDTQLIRDETYFVAEADGESVGCGGWSFRATLFGGDARAGRDAAKLDPAVEAAKIRAFFVDPPFARRGVGTLILNRCEQEARLAGFAAAELMSTLPGQPFYARRGYEPAETVWFPVDDGVDIPFVPMRKRF